MRDIILKALGELNIPVYQIEISEERSAELFFIKKTLDMRRIKNAVHCAVTSIGTLRRTVRPSGAAPRPRSSRAWAWTRSRRGSRARISPPSS